MHRDKKIVMLGICIPLRVHDSEEVISPEIYENNFCILTFNRLQGTQNIYKTFFHKQTLFGSEI